MFTRYIGVSNEVKLSTNDGKRIGHGTRHRTSAIWAYFTRSEGISSVDRERLETILEIIAAHMSCI